MGDNLDIAAAVLLVFIAVVSLEIVLAFGRLVTWLSNKCRGKTAGGAGKEEASRKRRESEEEVPKGRYRRGSVSHSWREASVERTSHDHDNNHHSTVTDGLPNNHVPSNYQSSRVHHHENSFRKDTHDYSNGVSVTACQYGSLDDLTVAAEGSAKFSCHHCQMSLVGYRYIVRDDHPFCIRCYEALFANTCEECKSTIGTECKDLSYKERHWHDRCFRCADCRKSLVDLPFAAKFDKIYCGDCHDDKFAPKCDGCGAIFRAGMKKYEYKGKQWHEQCFCCKVCHEPIGSKSFIPRDQEVICINCYEQNYAQHCTKCEKVISKGGVTYKGTPWHRDCFTCTHCNKVLAGEKFASRDEKPFCGDCFTHLFGKKCCRCERPITGLGGTKFISFEGRHWHSDCFVCYKCGVSLVGRGFLTHDTDILCPDCGRA